MTRSRLLVTLGSTLAGLTLLLTSALPGFAAAASSNPGGNGLKISPVVTNLTISPGATQTVPVYVENVTQAPVTLQVVINDFTASSDESGTPALLLNPNQYAPSHSLKRFVTPINNITLQPQAQKTANVNITIPKNAAGGGYYGAVRFAPASTSSNKNVTLLASVASLILVKVPGNINDDLTLAGLSAGTLNAKDNSVRTSTVFTSNKNMVAVVRFQNKGNVQEQPFGKILLKQGSKQLGSYEVNNTNPRGNVLPDSIRKFTINLDKVGSFGKYTLVGNFGYGAKGQLLSGTTTFYVVPVVAIVIVIVIILLILFFIFVFPKLVRRYNRRVVRKAGRR